jgi:hypothetical protein
MATVLPASGQSQKNFVITERARQVDMKTAEVVSIQPKTLYKPDRDYGYYQVGTPTHTETVEVGESAERAVLLCCVLHSGPAVSSAVAAFGLRQWWSMCWAEGL